MKLFKPLKLISYYDAKNKRAYLRPVLKKQRKFKEAWWFVVPSIVVLFVTTLGWSLRSAVVQAQNADQMVNGYMFESWATFKGAIFPGQHSFLLKWPLFLLMRLFGNTPSVYEFMTVALCLCTVGGFAYILYKIDRRPYVFGVYLLALSSILLLVPAQPYAGGILPVNMAMVTTRNIEYLVYFAALVFVLRSQQFKSRDFLIGTGLLTLLFASDKLFLSLSLGGAVLGLAMYGIFLRQEGVVSFMWRWLVGSVVATIGAAVLVILINKSGLTHISSSAVGPYVLISSVHSGLLGSLFALLGSLTNFGANPMYDAAVIRKMPHLFMSRIGSFSGPAYIANMALVVVVLCSSFKVLINKQDKKPNGGNKKAINKPSIDLSTLFSRALLLSSVAAVAAFIASDHYYVVDARYLSIGLFAGLVAVAVYLRTKTISLGFAFGAVAAGLLIAIICGHFASVRMLNDQQEALQNNANRNALVAHNLAVHKVDVLVGDYWRVLPIKQLTGGHQTVTPLDSCGVNRQVLTSTTWQIDLSKHSFAYLQTFDKNLTNYKACGLKEVLQQYGQPNNSMLIAGTPEQPKELLLYYERGSNRPSSATTDDLYTGTILPITLNQLPKFDCQDKPRILNVVAHQDDDLLFMNPDLMSAVRAKHCVRTVYVTAGDAGSDHAYWTNREKGVEAAYSKIIGNNDPWDQSTVLLNDGSVVTLASPQSNQMVSLLFMHLPDGNIVGQGFKKVKHYSVAGLESGLVKQLDTVDGFSSYTLDQLTRALASIIEQYQPTEIRTQSPISSQKSNVVDHSDHIAVGRLTQKALQLYTLKDTVAVKYYQGYPIRLFSANVQGQALKDKTDQFLEYAKYDPAVCHKAVECFELKSYGSYLQRQYIASP